MYIFKNLVYYKLYIVVTCLLVILELLIGKYTCLATDIPNKGDAVIPDVLVSYDPYPRTDYAIVVEKSTQKLFFFSNNGEYKNILEMDCATGENFGPKLVSGDRKTPEGIYFFTKKHSDKDLTDTYGKMAFPTDYPNLLDRIAGRNGYSIWLHGTNKKLKQRSSNGCIVLENDNITKLSKYISLEKTPIIIVEKIKSSTGRVDENISKSISNFLSKWNKAFMSGTYHDYLAFYDANYFPNIAWWPQWTKVRKKFKDIDLSSFDELRTTSIYTHNGIYLALFTEIVIPSNENLNMGTKKFYLTKKDGNYKIIGDEYQSKLMDMKLAKLDTSSKRATSKKQKKAKRKIQLKPLIAKPSIKQVAKPTKKQTDKPIKKQIDKPIKKQVIKPIKKKEATYADEAKIKSIVNDWLNAWSSKDINKYQSLYSSDFSSKGMDLKAWINYKKILNKKYKSIKVTAYNLVIQPQQNNVKVIFTQRYKSDLIDTTCRKHLVLKRKQVDWKIYREFCK